MSERAMRLCRGIVEHRSILSDHQIKKDTSGNTLSNESTVRPVARTTFLPDALTRFNASVVVGSTCPS
jgi:hypothetical protein